MSGTNVPALLARISQLEAEKQNISNQAAFQVGQQLVPLDSEITNLKGQILAATSRPEESAAPVAKPKRGRPKKSGLKAAPQEAVAS